MVERKVSKEKLKEFKVSKLVGPTEITTYNNYAVSHLRAWHKLYKRYYQLYRLGYTDEGVLDFIVAYSHRKTKDGGPSYITLSLTDVRIEEVKGE